MRVGVFVLLVGALLHHRGIVNNGAHTMDRLGIEDGAVIAGVRDEGPGFDPAAVRSEKGRHVGLGLEWRY